jgi:hypothetical protein
MYYFIISTNTAYRGIAVAERRARLQAERIFVLESKHYRLFHFKRVRKIAKKRLLTSSCLSICPFACLFLCPSAHPHGTTRLPLDYFLLNLMSISRKCVRKCNLHCNPKRIRGTLHVDQCTYCIISRSAFLKMRNVSVSVLEKIKTHILRMFSNFYRKPYLFMT